MYKKHYLGLLALLLCFNLLSQRADSYQFQISSRPYTDLSNAAQLSEVLQSGSISGAVNIGFTFRFAGSNYTRVLVSANGYITFNLDPLTANLGGFNGFQFSAQPMLAPLWDGLSGQGGSCRYKTEGISPNRVFIVQWKDWHWPDVQTTGAGYNNFQVRLYETTNKVEFHYGTGESGRGSATMGIATRTTDFLSISDLTSPPSVSNTSSWDYINQFPLPNQVYSFGIGTCSAPNGFRADSVLDNRTVLNWRRSEIGIPLSYNWQIQDFVNGQIVKSGTTTDTAVLVTGLAAATDYRAYLYAKCSNTDSSNKINIAFVTGVPADYTTPYFQGFEADSTQLPPNWDMRATSSNSTNRWVVRTQDPFGPLQGAAQGRVFVSVSGANNDGFSHITNLISPTVSTIGKTKRLIYKYWISNHPDYQANIGEPVLSVSVNDRLNSRNTVIFSHRSTNTTFATARNAGWQTQVINLVGFENNFISVDFAANQSSMTPPLASIAIDSFRIEDVSGCVPIEQLTATTTQTDSVLLDWKAANTQTKWEIQYGLMGFVLGRGNKLTATRHPFKVGGFAANTTYDFYVRAVCGVGDSSNWSERQSLKTDCSPISNFPYYENFDAPTINACWKGQTLYSNNGFRIHRDVLLSDRDLIPLGGRGYVETVQIADSVYTLQSPAFKLDAIPKHLTYYTANACADKLSVEVSNDQINWTAIYNENCNGFRDGTNWLRNQVDLSNYINKTIFLRFKYVNLNSSLITTSLIRIDELSIENNNSICLPPSEVAVSGFREDNSIEIAWTKGASETSWEIEYGINDFTIGTGTRTAVTGGESRAILRGANLADKEVYLRGICSVGVYTRWVGPVKLSNPRLALYTFSKRPESDSLPTFDWHTKRNGSGVFSGLFSSSIKPYSFELVSMLGNDTSELMVITPRLLNIKARTHQLRFRVKMDGIVSAGQKLTIGVTNSRYDSVGFRAIQVFNLVNNNEDYKTVSFANYNSDKEFIVFKWSHATTERVVMRVDSIEWTKIPTCGIPDLIQTDTIKYNGISASWQPPAVVPAGYKWRVLLRDNFVYSIPQVKKEGITLTNRVKIEGLNPATAYDLYLQSYCNSPTDTATFWTKKYRFTTGQSNDDCEEATPLTVYQDARLNDEFVANSMGVTTKLNAGLYISNGKPLPICAKQLAKDIWFTIITPNIVKPITIRTNASFDRDNDWGMDIYKGSCANLQYVGCKDDTLSLSVANFMPTYELKTYTPNTKYYIRLYKNVNYETGFTPSVWAHCSADCTFPPINDSCQNAINLVDNQFVNGTNQNATNQNSTNRIVPCQTNQQTIKDVWYKFHSDTGVLRTFRMQLTLFNTSPLAVVRYAIYTGSCADFVLFGNCKMVQNNQVMLDTINVLEANQDYFIRVWTTDTTEIGNFSLKIQNIQRLADVPIANARTINSCQSFAKIDVNTNNSLKWLSLVDSTSGIVGEINPNGFLLGQITGGYFVNSTGIVRRASGTPYLDRNIGIKVTNQPTNDVGVRLYFTEAERAAYFAVVGANPIAITHYAGALCLGNVQSGGGDLLPAVVKNTQNGKYYVEFSTRRFSGFFFGPNRSLVFTKDLNNTPHQLVIQATYPMPIVNELAVVFSANSANDKGRMTITDILGKIVLDNTIVIQSGDNTRHINMVGVPTGLYFLTINNGIYKASQKIIKH